MMSTLLLTRAEIARLMTPGDYLDAVEASFRLSSQGLVHAPLPIELDGVGGAFHAKAAVMLGGQKLAALKLNGNFPANPQHGLPTIQGVILLCDAVNGAVCAIMDSIEITLRRTAATSALAAKHLARPAASLLAVIGCGAQAGPQTEALAQVLPLQRVVVFDTDPSKARTYVETMEHRLGLAVHVASSLREATGKADVIVTCTTAQAPFLDVGDVAPGAFVAAVGADNPQKNEIAPALMAKAKVVPDVLAQCLLIGDLHHAVRASAMTRADVHADLGDIVTGLTPGRESNGEIVIFDSTGTAIHDVASAAAVYARATERGVGGAVDLA
jgi:ornithine cyclodeaminase/alanine dehydrogenase-like protein (mu-crystallin family)